MAVFPAVNLPLEKVPPNAFTAPAPVYDDRATDAPSAREPRLSEKVPSFATPVFKSWSAAEPSTIESDELEAMLMAVPPSDWAYSNNSALEPAETFILSKFATLSAEVPL